jgi:diguanylate cyclase (GGDEF) domain
MKTLNELTGMLKDLCGLDTLLINQEDIVDNRYKKVKLYGSDYNLYFPRECGNKQMYFIKRIVELFLRDYVSNIQNQDSLMNFMEIAGELLDASEMYINEDYMESRNFNFLDTIMDYAIIKDDLVIVNRNVDKYTLDTSLLKLQNLCEFSMYVKAGEVFALKIQHYKAILCCSSPIDDIVKSALRLRLSFLNKLFENELHLKELEKINASLEHTVMLRTMEVENKNELLQGEKDKLREANRKLVDLNRQLDELSRLDPLTNLSNRRGLQDRFDMEIRNFKRNKTALSLAIGDVDCFKGINDTYGHECGDSVLVAIGNMLRNGLREVDTISRYGGDEFIILLPEAGNCSSYSVLERLRSKLGNTEFQCNEKTIHITMSFGLFIINEVLSLTESIERADQALYKAKAQGRNKVVMV